MSRRIFVDNISRSVTGEALKELFEKSGQVESIEMPRPDHRDDLAHAFVVMSNASGALSAIKNVNSLNWNGTRLTVTSAGPVANRRLGFSGVNTFAERSNRK